MIYKFQVTLQNVLLDLSAGALSATANSSGQHTTVSAKDKLYLKFRFEEYQHIYVTPVRAPWTWAKFRSTFEYETKFISTLKDRSLLIQCKALRAYLFKKTLATAKIDLHTLFVGPTHYVLELFEVETHEYFGQVSFDIAIQQRCDAMQVLVDQFHLGSLLPLAQCVYPSLCSGAGAANVQLRLEVGYIDNLQETWTKKPIYLPLNESIESSEQLLEQRLVHVALTHLVHMDNFELSTIHVRCCLEVSSSNRVLEIARCVIPVIGNYDVFDTRMSIKSPVLLSHAVRALLPNRDEHLSIAFRLIVKHGPRFAQMKDGVCDRNGITGGIVIGFVFPPQDQMPHDHKVQFVCDPKAALKWATECKSARTWNTLYDIKKEFYSRSMNPELNKRGYSRVRRRMSLVEQTEMIERIGVLESAGNAASTPNVPVPLARTSTSSRLSHSSNRKVLNAEHEQPKGSAASPSLAATNYASAVQPPQHTTYSHARNSISVSGQLHPDPLPALDHLLLLAQSGALQYDTPRSHEFRGILNYTYHLHARWQSDLEQLRQDRLEFEQRQRRELITTDEQEKQLRLDRCTFVELQRHQRRCKERLYEIGLQVLRRQLYHLLSGDDGAGTGHQGSNSSIQSTIKR